MYLLNLKRVSKHCPGSVLALLFSSTCFLGSVSSVPEICMVLALYKQICQVMHEQLHCHATCCQHGSCYW